MGRKCVLVLVLAVDPVPREFRLLLPFRALLPLVLLLLLLMLMPFVFPPVVRVLLAEEEGAAETLLLELVRLPLLALLASARRPDTGGCCCWPLNRDATVNNRKSCVVVDGREAQDAGSKSPRRRSD